jgi:nucleotide-binding universal stress UspA family protein
VGVDGSEGSDRALKWARTMARITGAEILAVHGFDYVPMRGAETNDVLLEQTEGELNGRWTDVLREDEVPFRTIIEIEDPRILLDRLAVEHRADVIVVGSKGHSQVAALMLGSLASFLTQHAQVPVVVIPEGAALSAP